MIRLRYLKRIKVFLKTFHWLLTMYAIIQLIYVDLVLWLGMLGVRCSPHNIPSHRTKSTYIDCMVAYMANSK